MNIENCREGHAGEEGHTLVLVMYRRGLPLLPVLTSRPTDRRCRWIDSRRALLSAAIVLVKTRY